MHDTADRLVPATGAGAPSVSTSFQRLRGLMRRLLKAAAAMAILAAAAVLGHDIAQWLSSDHPFTATTLGSLIEAQDRASGRLYGYSRQASEFLWQADPLRDLMSVPLGALLGFAAVVLYATCLFAPLLFRPRAGNSAARKPNAGRAILAAALTNCRKSLISVGLFSGIASLLVLTSPLYMLEIYDRVIPSRSVPTLIGLSVIAAMLFTAIGVYEWIRSRMLSRIGAVIHEDASDRVFCLTAEIPLSAGLEVDGLQAVRDIDTLRAFFLGPAPAALLDLPWVPMFVLVLFIFHPLFGVLTLGGAGILMILAFTSEVLTSRTVAESARHAGARLAFAQSARQNAEVIAAMGMQRSLGVRWREINSEYLTAEQFSGDVSAGLKAIAKSTRLILQSAILGAGAYLVLGQQASAGVIVAASIIAARALAPIDAAIASWKAVLSARQSWSRLEYLFARFAHDPQRLALPPPVSHLQVEGVWVAPPGAQRMTVQNVSFVLQAGQGLGIVGPSGSGKSSLLRALVGAWRPVRGRVALDGASLDNWAPGTLGRHVGYLPQQVDLFAGTVAENICRFAPRPDADAVIAAARAAGIHELICELTDGYETAVGDHGGALSAGQQQLIGLARAFYADPFLIVMDEPNSNLDSDGEEVLTRALLGARARGSIVVVVAHRPSALAAVDTLLVMANGNAVKFGAKEEILPSIRRTAPPPVPLVAKSSTS